MNYLRRILQEMEEEDDEEAEGGQSIRRIYERKDPLTYFSDSEFKLHFRMEKESAMSIVEALKSDLEYTSNRNRPVSPTNQLLLALRFYASGAFFLEMGDFMGVSTTAAHNLVHKVTRVLVQYQSQWIRMPANADELRAVQEGHFKLSSFPKMLGLIYGTHIKICSQGGVRAEDFRNRRGTCSLNVQCIANSELKIMDVVASWPGSAHDSTIFNSSQIKARFELGEFGDSVLLGDSAFKSPYILTPLANPKSPEELLYNAAHFRSRKAVEKTFGMWKRRFPIMGLVTQMKVENVQKIIIATIILHNILIELNDNEPVEDSDVQVDWDLDEDHVDGDGDGDDDDDHDDDDDENSGDPTSEAQRKFINFFRPF